MRYLFILLLIFSSWIARAQQTPQFTQYMMNRYLYNPAFAGFEDYGEVKTGFRQQWTGLNSSNSSFYLTGHMALDKSDRTSTGFLPNISKTIKRPYESTKIRSSAIRPDPHQGFGIQIMGDQFGPLTNISIGGTYAYHIALGGEQKLSLATTIGMHQRILNLGGLDVKDQNDPNIINGKLSGTQPMINVGGMYYTRNFYIGGAVNQLIMDNYSLMRTNVTPQDTIRTMWLGATVPNILFSAGFQKSMNDDWVIAPSFMVKYMKSATFSYEANIKVTYSNTLWGGLSYRHKEAIAAMIGAQISDRVNVTYSYEVHSLGLSRTSLGSHELVLGIMLSNFLEK
jgi:type IX secretion system PorP/SprF family membrane protein